MKSGEMTGKTDRTGKRWAKRLVLIVEDNDLNREMLYTLLKDDFDIVEAVDGFEGLKYLEEYYEDLSLVLLDVYMPNCDGFEFLRKKREDKRFDAVPVIVTTVSGSFDDEIKCLRLGANDFVVKPYDFDIVMNRINNMIRLRESASIVNLLTWDDTGLLRKEFFFRAVEDAFASPATTEYDVLCSDVVNYQALVDRYGDANCEEMLRELANILVEKIPGLVVKGRIDSERFGFLLEHQPKGWEDDLSTSASQLPIPNVNLKFGIVPCVDRTMAAPNVCSRALRALETVKDLHGVDVAWFNDELHARLLLEQTIRESMEEALGDLQFVVFYQPKHDVHTSRVGGAEALVRWFHPEIGLVSPNMFIPIFEQNGFITKLDLYVLEEACKQVKRNQEQGLPVVPISVNASRLDFDVPNLPELIAEIADKHGVDHGLLHVELTETAYSDNPTAVIEMLTQLEDLGFKIELDDFGAGYSSLVSLNMLPLDVMKLDMSMVRQATKLNDFRIVESTIKLAQVLGLKTVVEGVETAEEAHRVIDMGCDFIQGYYYSKPLSQQGFEQYLKQDS